MKAAKHVFLLPFKGRREAGANYSDIRMSTLHPQTQAMIDAMARMNLLPPDQLTVEQARAQFDRSRAPFLAAPQDVGALVNTTIPGPGGAIPVRSYRPINSRKEEALPVLVFF